MEPWTEFAGSAVAVAAVAVAVGVELASPE